MLAGATRSEDSCCAHGATRSQRQIYRGIPGPAQEGEKGFLPRASGTSAACTGATADDGLRLDDLVGARIARQCEKDVEESACVLARRVAGWSGNVDFASRHYDPRCAGRKRKQVNRAY